MGNRGFIRGEEKNGVGVYLHWNGGRDSVEGFLKYCELKGCRGFGYDTGYAVARLTQVIANFFGGTTSVGIYPSSEEDMADDNGSYIVKGWKIVGREYPYDNFTEQDEYPLNVMLKEIDESQPESERLGELLDAEEVDASTVQIGDRVAIAGFDGAFKLYEVIGFGDDETINGCNVNGKPYVEYLTKDYTAKENINNYILTDKVLCVRGKE